MWRFDEKTWNPWKVRSPWHATALWMLAVVNLLAMMTYMYWKVTAYLQFGTQIERHRLTWWLANAMFLLLQILLVVYLDGRTKRQSQYWLTRASGYGALFLFAAVSFLFDPLIFVELGERGLWLTLSRTLIMAFLAAIILFAYALGYEKGRVAHSSPPLA